jgi:hypothetical protein
MTSRIHAVLAFAVLMFSIPAVAGAQAYPNIPNLNPGGTIVGLPFANSGPPVNPYLNLTNPFNSQTPVYQTIVRPLVDNQQAQQRLESDIQRLRPPATGGARRGAYGTAAALTTGHKTQFMNYSHFYARRR